MASNNLPEGVVAVHLGDGNWLRGVEAEALLDSIEKDHDEVRLEKLVFVYEDASERKAIDHGTPLPEDEKTDAHG